MPKLTSLIALPAPGLKDHEAAGLPLSGISLAGSIGLFTAVLAIELPLLVWANYGLLMGGVEPWHVALMLPGRLAGIYGIVHAGRLQALFTHTWLKTPARMLLDAWWSWTLGVIPMVAMIAVTTFIEDIQAATSFETAALTATVLAWLMFLTASPTWIWGAIRTAIVTLRVRSVSSDRYRTY